MSEMISKTKFAKHIKSIVVPQGFVARIVHGEYEPAELVYHLKSDTIEIKLDQSGCGHTSFLHKGNWLSFDRRGIEDSFYHLPMWDGGDVPDVNVIITEQIERVAEYLKVADTFIQVPDLPFTVTPKRLAELKKQLGSNKSVSFMPSGFGTGYMVAPRKTDRRDKRATQATEDFFGVSPLYISTFDAD